jgi:hypothetical protein
LAMPTGVKTVSMLTILAALGLAVASWIIFFLNFIAGGNYGGGGFFITLQNAYVLVPPLFALFGFAAGVCMLTGARYSWLWYAMVAFWAFLVTFTVWFGYTFIWQSLGRWLLDGKATVGQYAAALLLLVSLAYSIGCLLYFQKATVKEYFSTQ